MNSPFSSSFPFSEGRGEKRGAEPQSSNFLIIRVGSIGNQPSPIHSEVARDLPEAISLA
jgi:hypothetical protein